MWRPCRSELGAGKTGGAQSLFILVLVVRVGLDGAPVETRSLEWTEKDALVSLTSKVDQKHGRPSGHKGSFTPPSQKSHLGVEVVLAHLALDCGALLLHVHRVFVLAVGDHRVVINQILGKHDTFSSSSDFSIKFCTFTYLVLRRSSDNLVLLKLGGGVVDRWRGRRRCRSLPVSEKEASILASIMQGSQHKCLAASSPRVPRRRRGRHLGLAPLAAALVLAGRLGGRCGPLSGHRGDMSRV